MLLSSCFKLPVVVSKIIGAVDFCTKMSSTMVGEQAFTGEKKTKKQLR